MEVQRQSCSTPAQLCTDEAAGALCMAVEASLADIDGHLSVDEGGRMAAGWLYEMVAEGVFAAQAAVDRQKSAVFID